MSRHEKFYALNDVFDVHVKDKYGNEVVMDVIAKIEIGYDHKIGQYIKVHDAVFTDDSLKLLSEFSYGYPDKFTYRFGGDKENLSLHLKGKIRRHNKNGVADLDCEIHVPNATFKDAYTNIIVDASNPSELNYTFVIEDEWFMDIENK